MKKILLSIVACVLCFSLFLSGCAPTGGNGNGSYNNNENEDCQYYDNGNRNDIDDNTDDNAQKDVGNTCCENEHINDCPDDNICDDQGNDYKDGEQDCQGDVDGNDYEEDDDKGPDGNKDDDTDTCDHEPQMGFVYISMSELHSIALDSKGRIWTWGTGQHGQLGHGFLEDEPKPRMVTVGHNYTELPLFTMVGAGMRHSIALDETGKLWTWGIGQWGLSGTLGWLGHGTLHRDSELRPRKITLGYSSLPSQPNFTTIELPVFVSITASFYRNHALDEYGHIWSWGSGPLGLGGINHTVFRPTKLQTGGADGRIALPTFTSISAGWRHSIALDEQGRIWTWGEGYSGSLGHGAHVGFGVHEPRPRRIERSASLVPLPQFTSICAGRLHSIALDEQGRIWSWGDSSRTGEGSTGIVNRPSMIFRGHENGTLPIFTSISAGGVQSLAIDTQGNIWTWGAVAFIDVANIALERRPISLNEGYLNVELPVFKTISAGHVGNMVVDVYGQIWTWGAGQHGQLGHGATSNEYTPRMIVFL